MQSGRWLSGKDMDLLELLKKRIAPAAGVGAGLMYSDDSEAAIPVSHGSGSIFNKFDLSKIGTGEGAQAYGHGGYFASGYDSPVAADYAHQMGSREGQEATLYGKPVYDLYKKIESMAHKLPIKEAQSEYEKLSFLEDLDQQPSFRAALDRIDDDRTARWAKDLEDKYQPAGQLYNVDLKWPDPAREANDPMRPDHFIDYHAPLSAQPEKIRSILESAMPKGSIDPNGMDIGGGSTILDNRAGQADASKAYPWVLRSGDSSFGLSQNDVDRMVGEFNDPTGENIYSRIAADKGGQRAASDYLSSLGIPGIRYLDGGSRGAGQGSHNYVVFDDKIPEIKTRNGKPVEPSVNPTLAAATPAVALAAYLAAPTAEAAQGHPWEALKSYAKKNLETAIDNSPVIGSIKGLMESNDPISKAVNTAGLGLDLFGLKGATPLLAGMAKKIDPKKLYPGWGGSKAEYGDASYQYGDDGNRIITFSDRKHHVGDSLSAPQTSYRIVNPFDELKRKVFDIEKLRNSASILFNGDKTMAHGDITHINGKELENPVSMEGGPLFSEKNQGLGWGSYKKVMEDYGDMIRRAADASPSGRVYGIYGTMGGPSSDFAAMSTDAYMEMLKHGKIPKEFMNETDQFMSNLLKKGKGGHEWVGLSNIDDAKEQLRQVAGGIRSKFMSRMDMKGARDAGMPDVPSIRAALAEPSLLNHPVGMTGFSVAELDPTGKIIDMPDSAHTTYRHTTGGTAEGKMPVEADWKEFFPDVVESIRKDHPYTIPAKAEWGPMNMPGEGDVRYQIYTDDVLDALKKRLGLK